ncbi:hypothetical protein COCHEDRAFT_1090352 [Bipolaris maydis C5]|uniref:Myb-like domain-containing protein n=2 Tax=cellular organisms TaxID=131567 RepID=M2TDP3_COCH5|nr:hypothetical protein COCHEDRAFT_1090352 [Bipolaris maydis C5]KAJ6213597.1 hypothetical protein PSV09DRAFT_1090352 [Bipolaris maydis]KAJ6274816.1 hypothetical protein PSV08DRAFT_172228 [Bipolaris maydis]
MPDPSSAPRRLSLGYILGFSDKPYKDPKLPPLPPRPRRQSQLAELVASPGGLVEWTASDGRKGRLTGMGKPQLTAASLAKVPSGIQPPKEHSKKSTSKKLASNAENQWPTGGWDNLEVTGGSTKSTSKKAPSHKNDVWGGGGFNASVSNKGSQKTASNVENLWGSGDVGNMWVTQADTSNGDTKKDEKKAEKEGERKDDKKEERNAAKATKQATESGDSNETPAPNNTAAEEGEAKKPDDTNTWTKEQDNQLLQMKTENTPWKTIASNLGKPEGQCRTRFKIVKPVDWKPDNATNNAGKGNAGQKDARLDEQKQKQGTKDNNKDSNKEEDKKDSEVPDVSWGGTFGGTFGETSDDKQGEAEKANDTGTWETGDPTKTGDTSDAKDSKDVWINTDGASDSKDNDPVDLWGAAAAGWGANNPEANTATGWDTTNQETAAPNTWEVPVPNVQQPPSPAKPASAPRSTKAPSESRSRRSTSSKSKPSTTRPAEIELEPDDTFSANDLRLIARILQQDCSMVWSRLSWRFRDKTGRTLDPEVFEKKITGTVEAGWKGE